MSHKNHDKAQTAGQWSHLKLNYWVFTRGSGKGNWSTSCGMLVHYGNFHNTHTLAFPHTYRGSVFEWNSLQRICLLHRVSDEDLIVPQAVAAGASIFLEGARGVAYWLLLVKHEFRVIHVGHDLLKLQNQIKYVLIYVCLLYVYVWMSMCVCNCGKVKGVKVFLDFSFFPVGSTNSCDVIVMA